MDRTLPSPSAPEEAGKVDRLLPLIRWRSKSKGLFPGRWHSGLAVYPDRIVLFQARKDLVLPAEIFCRNSPDTLQAVAGVRIGWSVGFDEMATVCATRIRDQVRLVIRTGRGVLICQQPQQEIRHVVEVLADRLGERFQNALTAGDFQQKPARKGRLGIVIASVLAALGFVAIVAAFRISERADGWMAPIISGYGIFAFSFSALFLGGRWLQSISLRGAAQREPVRSRLWSIILRLAGICLFMTGALFPYEIVLLLGHAGWVDFYNPSQNAVAAGVINMGCIMAGLPAVYFGYRLGFRGADRVLREDGRPAVLFLRSFGDDGRHSFHPDSLATKLLGLRVFRFLSRLGPLAHLYPGRVIALSLGTARDTAEEQLASFFRKLGPFVAIGRPGEALAEGGAERFYVSHDTWQEKVLALLDRSAGVILQPADTSGVWWEIETCRRIVPPGRLLLSLINYTDSAQAYEEFRLRFEDLGGPPLPRSRGDALFYWIDPDNRVVSLPAIHHPPISWPLRGVATDFERTLWPFVSHLQPARFEKAPPARNRGGQRVQMAAALIVWCGLMWAGPLTFASARMSWRRSAAPKAEVLAEHAGRGAAYVWKLGPQWRETEPPPGNDRAFVGRTGVESAAAVVIKEVANDLDEIERVSRSGPLAFLDRRTEIKRRHLIRDGQEWLEVEYGFKTRQSPLEITQIRNFCQHPEGVFILQVQAPTLYLKWRLCSRSELKEALEGFRPPPLSPAWTYRDKLSRFSLELPEGWIEKSSIKESSAAEFRFGSLSVAELLVEVIEPIPAFPSAAEGANTVLGNLRVNRGYLTEWRLLKAEQVTRGDGEWTDILAVEERTDAPDRVHHYAFQFTGDRTFFLEAITSHPAPHAIEKAINTSMDGFRTIPAE